MTDRFDKFTERSRRVLQFALEEAQRFNQNYIGTEHILLGLVREHDGVAARVLQSMGIEPHKVRSAVEFVIGRGERMEMGEVGLTPRVKRVIELAVGEARRFNHHYIGTEHLLLGLVLEGEGIAAGVLESFGVSLDKVRAQVVEVLKSSSGYSSQGSQPAAKDYPWMRIGRFAHFTDQAREVLEFAQEEARRLNHNYLGTEHILLGLVREKDGVAAGLAASVLSNLGVELYKVRSAIEFKIGRGDRIIMGDIGLTPRAKQVIELALDEAQRRHQTYIGTEHLLLGLVDSGEGIAAGVLESLGISLERIRSEVLIAMGSSQGSSATQSSGLQILSTLFAFSIWARDKLLTVMQTVDDADLRKTPESGVYGSIHDTLVHMAVSEWMWVERCMGNSPMRLPTGQDFSDLNAVVAWWNDVHSQAVEFLDTIDEDGLAIERTYLAPDGKRRTRKIWHMLLQIVNHQTEHRAQLGTMLGQMGKEVPQTDLVVYLSEKKA